MNAAGVLRLGTLVPKEETVPFCPIRNAPICPEGRARSLPGFHLMSIDAAREALPSGRYRAYGSEYVIRDFEVLHPKDTVYECEVCHKVFLNQGSLQYHHYLKHEMKNTLRDKQRLRDAAERRKRQREEMQQKMQEQQQQQQKMQQEQQQLHQQLHSTKVVSRPQQVPSAQEQRRKVDQQQVVVEPRSTTTADHADNYGSRTDHTIGGIIPNPPAVHAEPGRATNVPVDPRKPPEPHATSSHITSTNPPTTTTEATITGTTDPTPTPSTGAIDPTLVSVLSSPKGRKQKAEETAEPAEKRQKKVSTEPEKKSLLSFGEFDEDE
ncbi:unnamed protein product [Amoebophrya sp. A25]|nr:unnamed protein product [Amoebophrya sp. A25]|eukprot:GSA25T00004907001.1